MFSGLSGAQPCVTYRRRDDCACHFRLLTQWHQHSEISLTVLRRCSGTLTSLQDVSRCSFARTGVRSLCGHDYVSNHIAAGPYKMTAVSMNEVLTVCSGAHVLELMLPRRVPHRTADTHGLLFLEFCFSSGGAWVNTPAASSVQGPLREAPRITRGERCPIAPETPLVSSSR